MKTIKIAVVAASSIMLALFFILLNPQKQERDKYNEVIHALMESNQMSSECEALAKYPELSETKKKIYLKEKLGRIMQSNAQDPMSAESGVKRDDLFNKVQRLNQLRKDIQITLKKFSELKGLLALE